MSFKRCFKCLDNLPLDSFYKHSKMGDGHLNKCKQCTKNDATKNRLERIEYYRAYDKARASQPKRVLARQYYMKTEEGKIAHARANANWSFKHPNRRKASHVVSNAVRDGSISKEPCIICGSTRVEGHHPDYDRPLDVVWLCVRHHKDVHLMVKDNLMAA